MTQKKKKSFSSVEEIVETYLPAYAKRQRERSPEHYGEIGRDLAIELARKFQAGLRR